MLYRNTIRAFAILLALSAFTWAAARPASAASDAAGSSMILVLDGVSGESTLRDYKGGIDIRSFEFGATSTVSASAGGGSGAGKPTYTDLTLTKYVDSATLTLLRNLASGKRTATGTLYVLGINGKPSLTITLKNITVTGDQVSGAESERQSETVKLTATELKFEYTTQGKDGAPGPKQTLEIDIGKGSVK
ncbi:type VI secretion system tube protein Hcp [Cohnella sp. REN36]|uniref:Hcp family type VI secretion system effector n=1 Tax=Cohnella sp. REN36 TaxID=2887347 RepID=UPI001D147FB8|nr:type VI secretion system tube protein Hcp [Cohnella sp. REN36]MCC3372639.1 type VI secretion system tube protein Hcp [Cohnella sp. REN36]